MTEPKLEPCNGKCKGKGTPEIVEIRPGAFIVKCNDETCNNRTVFEASDTIEGGGDGKPGTPVPGTGREAAADGWNACMKAARGEGG